METHRRGDEGDEFLKKNVRYTNWLVNRIWALELALYQFVLMSNFPYPIVILIKLEL